MKAIVVVERGTAKKNQEFPEVDSNEDDMFDYLMALTKSSEYGLEIHIRFEEDDEE